MEVIYIDILSEYRNTLEILLNHYNHFCNLPFVERDLKRIEVVLDEIKDVNLAISLLERRGSEKCGYRPRRSTLMQRADLHIAMMNE